MTIPLSIPPGTSLRDPLTCGIIYQCQRLVNPVTALTLATGNIGSEGYTKAAERLDIILSANLTTYIFRSSRTKFPTVVKGARSVNMSIYDRRQNIGHFTCFSCPMESFLFTKPLGDVRTTVIGLERFSCSLLDKFLGFEGWRLFRHGHLDIQVLFGLC